MKAKMSDTALDHLHGIFGNHPKVVEGGRRWSKMPNRPVGHLREMLEESPEDAQALRRWPRFSCAPSFRPDRPIGRVGNFPEHSSKADRRILVFLGNLSKAAKSTSEDRQLFSKDVRAPLWPAFGTAANCGGPSDIPRPEVSRAWRICKSPEDSSKDAIKIRVSLGNLSKRVHLNGNAAQKLEIKTHPLS